MKPTVGRIVMVDGNPAMVQKVHPDGLVDLWLFGDHSVQHTCKVEQGTEAGQWNWPPIAPIPDGPKVQPLAKQEGKR